jgi:predicted TIM-barrel fold metal-dependent hydrolase
MTVIDADAHVEEGPEAWSYLDEAFYRKRPFPVLFPEDTVFGDHNAAWVIDFKIRLYGGTPTIMNRSGQKGAPIGVQELTDVEGRIAAMKKAGIDKQIIFPTIWQGPVAEDPELETALAQSWNSFMAAQCAKSAGRLFFAAVIPYRRPDAAVAEIRRVKALGSAVGIYTHGIEWDMPLSNPDFWPIYQEAAAQDLPLLIHTGNTSPALRSMAEGFARPNRVQFPQNNPYGSGINQVLYGVAQLFGSSAMDDFPKLSAAILEIGCDWTPSTFKAMRRNTKIDDWLGDRLFVACAVGDDLTHVVDRLGDDFLITASDYPHGDAFREDDLTEQLHARGDLASTTIDKILSANPGRAFALGD